MTDIRTGPNGYPNWETYHVSLILDNEEWTYNFLRELALDPSRGDTYDKADQLKDFVEQNIDEAMETVAGPDMARLIVSSLTTHGLGHVEWEWLIDRAQED